MNRSGADPEGPIFVSAEATASVFSWPEAIAAVTAAYADPPPPAAVPLRTVAQDDGAWLRMLPALPPTGRNFGAKLMAMAPAAERPVIEYVIVLWDRETSRLAAFVDGHEVTAFRTAATSAAALDRLAAPGPIRLGVLGSGLEASQHVRAFAAVRQIEHLRVFSPNGERREAFAAAATADLGCAAEAVGEGAAAVEGASVVLAAARSHGEAPIVHGEWLADEVTVVSIGSTVPFQREIDVSVVAASDLIVCDSVEEVVGHTGDMLEAARAGIDFGERTFALQDLLGGGLDDRLPQAPRRLFKSVGGGLQDIVVAEVIVNRALEAGLTTPLPIEFKTKQIGK